MEDYPEYSAVGGDLVPFKPSVELRWWLSPTPGAPKKLQQKWIATKDYDGVTYTDEQWRDVPYFIEPA